MEGLRQVRMKICMTLTCIWMKSCCTRLLSWASQLISMREIQFLSHTCQQVLMMHQKLTHCQHMVVYVLQLPPQRHQGHQQIKWWMDLLKYWGSPIDRTHERTAGHATIGTMIETNAGHHWLSLMYASKIQRYSLAQNAKIRLIVYWAFYQATLIGASSIR